MSLIILPQWVLSFFEVVFESLKFMFSKKITIFLKFIYSEKATNFAKSSPYFWLYVGEDFAKFCGLQVIIMSKQNLNNSSNFCGLLRKLELWVKWIPLYVT